MRIGVPKETAAGERRVALVPDTIKRLAAPGLEVLVEQGAGEAAHFSDQAYAAAGASLVPSASELFAGADLVLKVQRPLPSEVSLLRPESSLVAFLQPSANSGLFAELAKRRVTALAMELVPRISRAQSMDALSSQATVAGYKAVLLAAAALGQMMPMLTTAAGTIAPAKVFVIGAGVAGLQAIATSRRLGAVVSAFDIRPAVKEQVQSLGASFVEAAGLARDTETQSGYARELAQDEQQRTLDAIAQHISSVDVVVTTALVPGRPAPKLITAGMISIMRPGSVIVDLAAEAGGNCELTRAGETIDANGVTVLGPVNLPATLPQDASQMYSRNLQALVLHLFKDGQLVIDLNDPIAGAMVVTHQGEVRRKP